MLKAEKHVLDRLYVRFTISAVAVIAAFLLRQSMVQYLGMELPPFITFYPIVMVVAVLAGFWPGLLATGLASLLADYWIFPPPGHFAIASSSDAVGLAFFAGMGVFMSVVAEGYRRNQRRITTYKQEQAQRESDEKLRQSEEQFETLANAMPQLCWMANSDGWIFWYNQRWYSYTGTTPKQMEGWGWQSVHNPETLPKVLEQWQGSIATGEPFDMVFPLLGADGVSRPFLTRVMPVKDADGKVVRWFGTNTDISAQKQVEAELRKSEERYRDLFNAMDEGFCVIEMIFDAEGKPADYRFLEVNAAFEKQTGLHDAKGKLMRELAPSHEAHWFETYGKIALTGQPMHFVNEAKALNRYYDVHAYRVGQPEMRRVAIVFNDFSEYKRAEEARARLAAIVESSMDAIIGKNLDGIVSSWNKSAERLFGYTAEEIIGQPITLIIPAERQGEEAAFLERLRRGDSVDHYETVRVDKSGRCIDVSVTISPIYDSSGAVTGISKIVRDITQSKQAEQALRASEERWATTLRSIGDAVVSTDATGHVEFMNDVAQKLTGWPIEEARGRALDLIFNIVQEVTRIKPESPVAKVIRLGNIVGLANHTVLIGRDGTEIPIDDSAAPIRDRDNQIVGVVLVFHDVSEQRMAEKALRESDRLATTGRLAATIAHEIHNPLDAVGNLLHLIGQGTKEDATREFASMAGQELVRITQITQQMLTFQREAAKPIPVRIGEILDNVLALYERKIKSAGITLEQEIEFDNDILALPGELRQMFANLVGNAIEAVGSRRGTITLRAYSSQDWRHERPGLRVVVADDGPGIPADVRSKIFEPFFTTKGESGTGLGLWITSDILRKYEGTMRLRTSTQASSSGTCFSIFLPFETSTDSPGCCAFESNSEQKNRAVLEDRPVRQ